MHLLDEFIIHSKLNNSNTIVKQPRLNPFTQYLKKSLTVKFFFDFSSPWSYLAYSQIPRIQRECGTLLKIELYPVLVGALFKE